MMRKRIKKMVFIVAKPLFNWYFSKKRGYTYKSIKAEVFPEVFSPHFILSTRILLDFISTQQINNSNFLELGSGSGTIAAYASTLGAMVTATDINPLAVENTKLNAQKHKQHIKCYVSDLFDQIPTQQFDFIIVNPPYYPKPPKNMKERAWFCGENFEYFFNFFNQLQSYISNTSNVFMILSEDCNIQEINKIADQYKFEMILFYQTKKWFEENFIFQIKPKNNS